MFGSVLRKVNRGIKVSIDLEKYAVRLKEKPGLYKPDTYYQHITLIVHSPFTAYFALPIV
jgi:hypothetical protein